MKDWMCVTCLSRAELVDLPDGRRRPFCSKHSPIKPPMAMTVSESASVPKPISRDRSEIWRNQVQKCAEEAVQWADYQEWPHPECDLIILKVSCFSNGTMFKASLMTPPKRKSEDDQAYAIRRESEETALINELKTKIINHYTARKDKDDQI